MQATKILDPKKDQDIEEAVRLLKAEALVALPTETVYGLAALAWSKKATAKIFAAKNRAFNNPLIWHVHSVEAALKLFDEPSLSTKALKRFYLLANKFWPGPLTLVAKKSPSVSNTHLESVALRIPRLNITLKILKILDAPLVMPSANISSRPSPTSSAHVLKTLDGRIDALLDAGACEVGIESSVLRFDGEEPILLRPGRITKEDLENILGEKILAPALSQKNPESPGMLFKHYAPLVTEVLLKNKNEIKPEWHQDSTIIARSEDMNACLDAWGERLENSLSLRLPDDPQSYAQCLYEALYKAEERPSCKLVIIKPPKDSSWSALHDRLKRSAS